LESFWYTCFPKSEDDEQKTGLLIWIEDCLAKLTLTNTFATEVSLYDYEYALNLKATIKKSPASEAEILTSAQKNNKKTFEDKQSALKKNIQVSQKCLTDIRKSIKSLNETIKKILKVGNIVSFSKIISNVDKIFKIIEETIAVSAITEKTKSDIEEIGTFDRREIYIQLQNLAQNLKRTEKHSPAPFILDLVVSWMDKSLFEIINDLQTGDTEGHKLLKILINK
jgi:hypothetical protein